MDSIINTEDLEKKYNDFIDSSRRLHEIYKRDYENDIENKCAVCYSEFENSPPIVFKDEKDRNIKICEDCAYCSECDENFIECEIDADISNWMTVKKPSFAGGWAFMPKEVLEKCLFDQQVLLCNCCAEYYCDKCLTICKNICRTCYGICDVCDCDDEQSGQ